MLVFDEEKSRKRMFKFLLKHLALGVTTGWIVLGVFLAMDVAGLRTLPIQNHVASIVFPLLFIFFAITFGSVAMGIGVMSINEKDDDDFDGGLKSPIIPNFAQLKPVPVKVRGK